MAKGAVGSAYERVTVNSNSSWCLFLFPRCESKMPAGKNQGPVTGGTQPVFPTMFIKCVCVGFQDGE